MINRMGRNEMPSNELREYLPYVCSATGTDGPYDQVPPSAHLHLRLNRWSRS
jgi:hypothetical protein